MNKKHSENLKQKVLELYDSGEKITHIAKKYCISRSTLYNWLNERTENDKTKKSLSLTKREYFEQNRKVERLEKMVEILRNAPYTLSVSSYDKYDYITSLENKYNITLICEALGVARGSYFNHIKRNKKENTTYAQKRNKLTPIIREIFEKSEQVYGAGKIHAILQDRGHKVSYNTVASIMHDNGWFAIGTNSKKLYLMNQKRKTNMLKRNFNATRPNETWVSDVTYFYCKGKTYYICVIIDLYARKVVGCKISHKNSTQLTKATLKEAYVMREPENLTFHSDQGANYTSRTFTTYLKELGIKPSLSKPGTPHDNAVMESFFKYLKTEKLYRTDFRSEREFKNAVKEYVITYNEKRPHSFIGFKTPNEYEAIYYKKMYNTL